MELNDKIVIYQTSDGQTQLDVHLENDTVWLNRQQLSILFNRDIKTIGKHINNALREELQGIQVVAKFATTAASERGTGMARADIVEDKLKLKYLLQLVKMMILSCSITSCLTSIFEIWSKQSVIIKVQ